MAVSYQARQRQLIAGIRGNLDAMAEIARNVPMRADHANAPGRCLTTVMFLPATITEQIERRLIAPLRATAPHHYYNPRQSMHVTVKNVRNTADPPSFQAADIRRVHEQFCAIIPLYAGFTLSFEDLIVFPTSLSLIGYCDERLKLLVDALDYGLEEAGLPDDKRYLSDEVFFGNITLCRFTKPPESALITLTERLAARQPLEVNVDHVELITCNAACAPQTIERQHRYELIDIG